MLQYNQISDIKVNTFEALTGLLDLYALALLPVLCLREHGRTTVCHSRS